MQNINRNRTMQILFTIFHMQTLMFICKKVVPTTHNVRRSTVSKLFFEIGIQV